MAYLFDMFEATAVRQPKSPAICIGGRSWTYAQLQNAAWAIAAALKAQSRAQGSKIVALASSRDFAAYAGLLGILASGAAYVPFRLDWPLDRLASVFSAAKVSAAVYGPAATHCLKGYLDQFEVKSQDLKNLGVEVASWCSDPAEDNKVGHIQYVLFTTGSTGKPKSVAISGDNLAAFFQGMKSRFHFGPEDRFSQMSDLAFDVSVAEMFLCWSGGGCLFVPSLAGRLKPFDFIRDHQLTVWSSVPTVISNLRRLDSLSEGAFSSLRLSLFAGEALSYRLIEEWKGAAPNSDIVNLYGPTEATIFATSWTYLPSSDSHPLAPIGKPLPGITAKVVGEDGGCSENGELWLAGPQVASEYGNEGEVTRLAFVSDNEGMSWYKTGDFVEKLPNGDLRYLGRLDGVVKCRGFRIDTNEIAAVVAAITSYPTVVVPMFNADATCECTVAFCEGADKVEYAVRFLCAKELPSYMVPRRVLFLDEMPLNANGKSDRHALRKLARQIVNEVGE